MINMEQFTSVPVARSLKRIAVKLRIDFWTFAVLLSNSERSSTLHDSPEMSGLGGGLSIKLGLSEYMSANYLYNLYSVPTIPRRNRSSQSRA